MDAAIIVGVLIVPWAIWAAFNVRIMSSPDSFKFHGTRNSIGFFKYRRRGAPTNYVQLTVVTQKNQYNAVFIRKPKNGIKWDKGPPRRENSGQIMSGFNGVFTRPMKESSKDYSLDPTRLKYYTKYGNWFMRLPLGDGSEDDDLYAMRAVEKGRDLKCPYCMNRCGDHTVEELVACLHTERARTVCPTCGKLDEDHLDDEYNECFRTRPVLKKAQPPSRRSEGEQGPQ